MDVALLGTTQIELGVIRGEVEAEPEAFREMKASLLTSFCFAGFGTFFSLKRSVCSSPFFIVHCVMRPSLEIDTSFSPRSLFWSTQRSSQTGPVCFWV